MIAATAPLAELFGMLSSRLGGDAEALAEDEILRLVEEARTGDPVARRRLYTQHVDRVFRTVRGILASAADAEDVTQDAMLTVLTSLHKYRPRDNARFAAWVTTIAINTARRRFRRHRPELTATGELPEPPAETADPADDLDDARRRRALLAALRELAPREREIVSLRYGAELNASEIATVVGLEPATIRKILERARTHLGERIEALLNPPRRNAMNDEALSEVWMTLDPAIDRRRRIDARVSAWLEASDTPLAAEWLGLFTVSPFAALGLVTVSALMVFFATPLLWLARVLM